MRQQTIRYSQTVVRLYPGGDYRTNKGHENAKGMALVGVRLTD